MRKGGEKGRRNWGERRDRPWWAGGSGGGGGGEERGGTNQC